MPSVYDILDQYMNTSRLGSFEDIYDACSNLDEQKSLSLITDFEKNFSAQELANNNYAFVSDSRLSGIPVYCSASTCRKTFMFDVASFGALYADRIYLCNPFSYASAGVHSTGTRRHRFIDDLALAIEFSLVARPLLEAGIIQFSKYDLSGHCVKCSLEAVGLTKNKEDVFEQILESLYKTTELTFVEKNGEKLVFEEYDESHGEHELWFHSKRVDELFQSGKKLSLDEAREIGVFGTDMNAIAQDFFLKNKESKRLNANRILSNSPEISLIKSLSGANYSNLINIDYPTLYNAPLADVMRLRESEWDHLEKFRAFILQSDVETIDDAQNLVREIKEGQIELSQKISAHKRTMRNTAFDNAIPGTFGLGGAFAATGLNEMIAGAIAVLGGGHLTKSALPALRESFQEPDEVKSSPFYYPWKISKLSK